MDNIFDIENFNVLSDDNYYYFFRALNNADNKQIEEKEDEIKIHSIPFKDILLLAIATSIDALAVGVSFAFLKVNLFVAITTIGITTFILSFVCVLFGKKLGSLCEKYAEYLGGIILILLGIKILIEHLFF